MPGKIILECGFEATVDEAALDNMELVDALAELDDNPIAISKVVTMVFGKDQKKQLYDCLRNKNGVVPTAAVGDAIADFFSKFSEAKNS